MTPSRTPLLASAPSCSSAASSAYDVLSSTTIGSGS